MSIRIITDSASDFTLEELTANRVELIPMPLLCGEDAYTDDKTTSMEVFWQMLIDGTDIKTSQPSPETFVKAFEDAKRAGDEVVCILISSKLSGTYQGAMLARSMVDYEPIYVIDSQRAAASVAEKLLVRRACELRDKTTLSAREIAADLEGLRSRVRLFACLDTLEYLARGGRIPKAVAGIGGAMKVKPIITLSAEGEVKVVKKVLGAQRAMREMVEEILSHSVSGDYQVIPIYAHDSGNCREFMNRLVQEGFQREMKEPEPIGATIGTYIGPCAYGIVFVER